MSMTGYRGANWPVAIGGTFMPRVQNVNITRTQPTVTHYELGNAVPVGISADAQTYTGDMTFFPIDNKVEAAFLSLTDITNAQPRGIVHYINAPGASIATPKESLGEVRLTSLQYSARVGGEFTGTITFEGASYGAGQSITATAPSGVSVYTAKDITVTIGGTQLARAQGFTVRARLDTARLFQLGSLDPVAVELERPNVTASIDFVESDAAAGNVFIPENMPVDMVITVSTGTGAKRITLLNVISSGTGSRGTVNGYVTKTFDYVSKGDSNFGGLKIDKV